MFLWEFIDYYDMIEKERWIENFVLNYCMKFGDIWFIIVDFQIGLWLEQYKNAPSQVIKLGMV